MAILAEMKRDARIRRHVRVRKQVSGTPERPRLAVFRSSRHIYAQVIDDTKGITLVAASSQSPELKETANGANIETAKAVGRLIGEKAVTAGIAKAVFDRGGFLYHGRIEALADAARAAGLDMGKAADPEERKKTKATVAPAKGQKAQQKQGPQGQPGQKGGAQKKK